MRRVAAAVLVAVVVLAGWGGYSAFVFTDQPDRRTIVMADDSAAPGAQTAAHVVVEDPDTGERVADADVTVYLVGNGSRRVLDRGTTGPNGSYTARFRAPNATGSHEIRVAADHGGSVDAVTTNLTVERTYSILVETDRPVYRPGDTIQVRGLVRERGGTAASGTATVVVTGPKGNRLFSREVDLNEYGTGEIGFPLSSEAPPGRYRVAVEYDGERRTRTVTVKRYEKPRFDVQFRTDRSYYRPGDTVQATVVSEYFFGEPVANGTVSVVGEGYVGDLQEFAVVNASTDEQGVATLQFELPGYFAGLPSEGGKGVVVLNVSVTDAAGHTETVTRKIPVARGSLVLNAFTADGKIVDGVPNTVYVTAEYPDGRPAETTVTVETPEGTRTVETNEYGIGKFTYRPDGGEDRRITLVAREAGERVSKNVFFELERGNRIAVAVDRGVYDVGETMAGKVYVGETSGVVYLDVVGDGRTLLTRTVEVENGSADFSIPVTPAMQGNVRVRAWSVFGNNRVGADARRVLVRPAGNVSVNVTAGKSTYRPGEPATLTVRTARNGTPVDAAVGLDVVDESVFAVEQRRAGMAAVHFELERELTRPRLFVHDYSAGRLRESPESDAEQLAREASVSRMPAPAGGSAVDSYARHRERIEERRAGIRHANGYLWLLALVALPVGVVAAGFRRRDPRTHATDLGVGTALLGGGLLVGGVATVVVIGLAITTGILALLAVVAIAGALVVGGLLVDWEFDDLDFSLLLGGTFLAYLVVLAGGGALGTAGLVDLSVLVAHWWAALPTFLLFPVAFVGVGEDLRRRAYKGLVAGMALALLLSPVTLVAAFALGGGGLYAAGGTQVDGVRERYSGGAGGSGGGSGGTGDDGSASATEVRQYFPDTLASRTVVTGPDGRATTRVRMADTITTWRVSATASTRSGAVGSSRSSIRVFQPFFVKPDVPRSLTRNDTVTVPVSVFNYGNHTKNVTVRLRGADWFTTDDETTATVVVPPSSARRATFTVTATRVGQFPLTVVATGRPARNAAGDADDRETTTDAVRKQVTVRPPGKTRTVASSGTVSGTERATVRVPGSAVENSTGAVLRIYPGAYGQTVQGIERLLSMPTGCFEQTSSSLYPDVLVLRYMERTGRSNPELRATAERYVTTGYQRLLTFETSTEGGYSLFGEDPPNLLLTAYGLQEMSDMSEVHAVDPQVIAEMQRYLASQQRSDGSWPAKGRLEYSLGISGDPLSTTAYVTWSLAHSGRDGEAVRKGTGYLRRNLDVSEADTTTLAVSLNALAAAGRYPDLQADLAAELESRATVEDGTVHWKRTGDGDGYRYGGKSVLTTALVTHGLLESGHRPGLTRGAVDWIVAQKTGRGGWGSTQNTVMALRVLLKAQTTTGDAKTGTVTVERNGERVATVEVNETTRDEVRTVVLPAGEGKNAYEITGPEDSGLYYELSTEYNVPWSAVERRRDDGPIDMEITYDRTNLTVDDTVTLEGRITVEEGRVGTALIDLGVPPGFAVVESSLERLEREGAISRYELRGRQLILYAEDVSGTLTFAVRLRATQPIEARSGSARVYDYYNPEDEAVDAPVTLHVRPRDRRDGPGRGQNATAGNASVRGR